MDPNQNNKLDSVRGYYAPIILQAEANAKDYALFATKSLVTLNAGVAIAYPTIAELISDKQITVETVFFPILLAITGAVIGVLTAYVAYLNYGFEAHSEYQKMQSEIMKVEEKFDQITYHRFRQYREETQEFYLEQVKKNDRRRQVFYYLGNALGILSLVFFVISIVTFALSLSA